MSSFDNIFVLKMGMTDLGEEKNAITEKFFVIIVCANYSSPLGGH